MSTTETIIGVAIVVKNKLYSLPKPNRHHHCIQLAFEALGHSIHAESQGFMTNTGRYVEREEALAIAKAANQIIRQPAPQYLLFSEDLW